MFSSKRALVFGTAFFLICAHSKHVCSSFRGKVKIPNPFRISSRLHSAPVNSAPTEKENRETGHQASSNQPELSEIEQNILNNYREHQQKAARLSVAEEVRTLVEQSTGYGVLSTNRCKFINLTIFFHDQFIAAILKLAI